MPVIKHWTEIEWPDGVPAPTKTEPERIPLEAVTSSNLSGYGYDASAQRLAVQFKNGRIFEYTGCPLELAREFGAAESKGRFYATKIRGTLAGTAVTGPCNRCGDEGYLTDKCSECGCGTYTAVERRYGHTSVHG